MNSKRPVLLTSLPRSGSTWCLNVLQQANNVKAMHEPDHLDYWECGENGMHPFIRPDNEDYAYEYIYKKCFSGHRRIRHSLSKHYLKSIVSDIVSYIPSKKRVIVKSVYSLANTEWIYNKFDPQVIVLLRNPYSICHSIHRKWPNARLKNLLNQSQLMEDVLEPYREVIEKASSPYQVLASRIGAYYRVVLDAANRHEDWITVKHEDLCSNPVAEYRSIFERLQLKWDEEVEHYLRRTNQPKNTDDVQHVQRVASEEIDKWRKLLSKSQIYEIRDVYESFNNRVYDGMANSA